MILFFLCFSIEHTKSNQDTSSTSESNVFIIDTANNPLTDIQAIQKKTLEFEDIIFRDKYIVKLDTLKTINKTEFHNILPLLGLPSDEKKRIYLKEFIDKIDEFPELRRFYYFDISGDGIDDLIFNGFKGGEELGIIIWIKSGTNFYFSNAFLGEIKRFIKELQNKPYKIVTRSGFCCASHIGNINLIIPELNNDHLMYSNSNTYKLYYNLSVPDSAISPIEFQVTQQNCKLRYEPIVNNNIDSFMTSISGKAFHGNILAEFEQGSDGVAFAEKNYCNNKWWFVALNPNSRTINSQFYNDIDAYKLGWIDSRYLNTENSNF